MEMKELGSTGLIVSKVGFGVLPIGPSQLALPVEDGAAILKYALENGINFVDTAQYYQTYPYISEAIKQMKKTEEGTDLADRLVISSKSLTSDYEEMWEAIQEARVSLDRDVIDIFLMHEVRSGQLEGRAGAWKALKEARDRGLVRAIGLSTHHVDIVSAAAQIPELDVVFPLINYAGLGIRKGDSFASPEEMLEAIKECSTAGKGIFAMKAFGGGSLTSTYQKALNYVFGISELDSVMIGFGSVRDVNDMLSYLDGTMPSDYNPDVSGKRVHISQDDCEGCGSCKAACPNGAIFWNEDGLAEVNQNICLTCGYCTPACPVRALIMY